MSDPTHTPGPWTYDEATEELRAASGAIGVVEPASGPLCAAAPDLLAACEAFIEHWPYISDATAEATRAAIAKARGGS